MFASRGVVNTPKYRQPLVTALIHFWSVLSVSWNSVSNSACSWRFNQVLRREAVAGPPGPCGPLPVASKRSQSSSCAVCCGNRRTLNQPVLIWWTCSQWFFIESMYTKISWTTENILCMMFHSFHWSFRMEQSNSWIKPNKSQFSRSTSGTFNCVQISVVQLPGNRAQI